MIRLLTQNRLSRKLIKTAAVSRANQFKQRNPLQSQRQIFNQLLKTAANTSFGRDYGFSHLAEKPFQDAYSSFRQRIPIRNFQEFREAYFTPHESTMADGGKDIRLCNVTWPGKIRLFCETSGTTAPTKHIPFSEQMFKENRQAALDLISCYIASHGGEEILDGKILYMSGPTTLSRMENGALSGDMSAITLRLRPWYLKPFVEPQETISSLPWNEKLQAMAELLLSDPKIRVISGVPPWILLLLRRCGEISGMPVSKALPQLKLIIHGGTSIKPYQREFEELFGNRMPELIELLPSSEAFMGFQCAGEPQMRLTPYYGVFFEFVRFEELDENGKPEPYALSFPLEQIETGQRYSIILSSCAGLWRYHIGDTIRFNSKEPYLFEFTGRDRILDKLEEKVTQEELEQTVSEINLTSGNRIKEFMVGTDTTTRRHIWVVAGEFKQPEQLKLIIDSSLQAQNSDYKAFRRQGRIKAPEIICAAPDEIYHWSENVRNKLGGQTKIPHIDPTADSMLVKSLRQFCGDRNPIISN